jgi:colicin import membrane protein
MVDATPYTVPKEPGRWRALMLAAAVHAALLAFLWIGVRWQNETPATIEAEVWSPQPREAAPRPDPVKAPEPEPQPKPVVREPPKPETKEPAVAKPDIALDQEKKKRKLQEEKQKQLDEERLAKAKQIEEERQAKLRQQQKLDDERQAKLKEEKLRQDKEKAEKDKKVADAKRKQQEADEKLMAKLREEDMKRITGAVAGTGGTGEAAKSQGGRADASYAARVAAKIKSNISFIVPEGLASNPPVEVAVNLLPDGSLAGVRVTKPSGVPGFDEAVTRAIEKSQPYPKDKSGSVPSSFIGIHRPKDQ